MKNLFSQYSLCLSLLGIVIGVGQYFTPIYSSNILYLGIVIYLMGFSCGIMAFGKHEKGLMKYFSLTSFVVIPTLIMLGMLLFAINFVKIKKIDIEACILKKIYIKRNLCPYMQRFFKFMRIGGIRY